MDNSKLIIARASEGLTISELSELSGVSRHTISRIEKGLTSPRPNILGKLAKALNKTVEYFIMN